MNLLFIFTSALLIICEVYIYVHYTAIAGIISTSAIILLFLSLQILKKLGYDIDIFKANKKDIKIIDETAIIDGRILDIVNSRFLSGQIIVPKFIVEKLQKMSNSSDPIEKAKGRRGLDVIARLGENDKLPFKITSIDYENQEISKKIIMLAKELKASIITTDFMVNKNGAIENVSVLNVNDLALSLKPIILPGEEMGIFIMKEGKEKNQGVGYLDDGTMVVIEEGHNYIGRKMDVIVQSILQTSSGRIIFTKIKFNDR
ncbi:MAG: hypothetical protein AB1602_05715 [Elusimicrobiota bacterium]